ncbi:MAG: DNA polymerase III subunit alpha [Parcubacteria group bacterium]|nr:DNA polymerase III subunit alpha [Parcubacteria group bacterium]
MDFVHLHLHSHYSLLDGLAKIEDIVTKAAGEKMPGLALTDHGVMYGSIEFYQKCLDRKIKPIIGIECYYAPNGRHLKRARIDDERNHLILLARNNAGYQNLLKLTSISNIEGFYYKPRIDWEVLCRFGEGLICLSACLQGEIPRLLLSGKKDLAVMRISEYQKVFGRDNYYLELQHHPHIPEQGSVNAMLLEIADALSVPLVATCDVHYLEPNDNFAQDILVCVQTGKKVSDRDRMTMMNEDFSFQSAEAMRSFFPHVPSALENTVRIMEQCDTKLSFGKSILPHFHIPEKKSPEDFMKELCVKGLHFRFGIEIRDGNPVFDGNDEKHAAIESRMEYELGIINRMGFASYFLIVADFVVWAKDNGILVGPSRGSGGSSLVAYLLRITEIDPLKYDLLFERFLNPDRVSMPDFDIDFADTRREEVIAYVEKKYGKEHVSQIITFGTMAARVAIRDVGRVLDVPYAYCDHLAKLVPAGMDLKEAVETVSELSTLYDQDPQCKRLIDVAKKLEGVARHSSTHACGILITKEPLENYVPVQYASKEDRSLVSQYSLKPVESLGLLKMDFLGLKNLTILEDTLMYIKKIRKKDVRLEAISFEDKPTFQLLRRGDTTGVFQLESSGMKRYLKQLQSTGIEDIIAMVSLYRPGPMEFIPDYIDGKLGRKKIEYLHPKLEPILKKTYGIAVYQEQIIQISRDLAGFSYGEADVLRRAVGKKIKELLDEQEEKMILGMKKNGIDGKTAKKIWDFIVPFARYGFNRSHAAGYAIIAYQTAYLKANFPVEFMAALLNADAGDIERIAFLIDECKNMNIEVLAPDVNESYARFTVVAESLQSKPRIRFGLSAIKNLGDNIASAIIEERKKNGLFASFEDFLRRVTHKDLNKKSLESLAKSGSFASLLEQNKILGNIEHILQFCKTVHEEAASMQSSLFGGAGAAVSSVNLQLLPLEAYGKDQKLAWEKEFLGLYISEHPFSEIVLTLKDSLTLLADVMEKKEKKVICGGVVGAVKKIMTKNNEMMVFCHLEDTTKAVEIIVFPKVFKESMDIWQEGAFVLLTGKVSTKNDEMKIIVETVVKTSSADARRSLNALMKKQPEMNGMKHAGESAVFLRISKSVQKDQMLSLKNMLQNERGSVPVYLFYDNDGQKRKIDAKMSVNVTDSLKRSVESLLGPGSFHLTQS